MIFGILHTYIIVSLQKSLISKVWIWFLEGSKQFGNHLCFSNVCICHEEAAVVALHNYQSYEVLQIHRNTFSNSVP